MTSPLASTTTAYADLVALLRGVPEASQYAEPIAQAALIVRPDDPKRFALLVAAVGTIETAWGTARDLDKPGPGGRGDGGHGHGLMQIDDRSHAAFLAQTDEAGVPLWSKAPENIMEGARILDAGLLTFAGNLTAGVACYNAGPHLVHKGLALTPPDPDAFTVNRYAERVISHYRRWSLLVVPDGKGGLA